MSHAAVLLERAIEYRRILNEDPTLTHAAVAEREGVSRSRISQILMLLRLPEHVKHGVLHSVKPQQVTEANLRTLLRAEDPEAASQRLATS